MRYGILVRLFVSFFLCLPAQADNKYKVKTKDVKQIFVAYDGNYAVVTGGPSQQNAYYVYSGKRGHLERALVIVVDSGQIESQPQKILRNILESGPSATIGEYWYKRRTILGSPVAPDQFAPSAYKRVLDDLGILDPDDSSPEKEHSIKYFLSGADGELMIITTGPVDKGRAFTENYLIYEFTGGSSKRLKAKLALESRSGRDGSYFSGEMYRLEDGRVIRVKLDQSFKKYSIGAMRDGVWTEKDLYENKAAFCKMRLFRRP